MKKLTKVAVSAAIMASAFAVSASADGGKVYYLNFAPEVADQWEALAEQYSEETGTEVQVVTAASGTYESTLKSEMDKSDAPTLFQVNGPVGLEAWKDYCYDLKDTEVYKDLASDDFALINEDGSVSGIAYKIETYGLIYNKTLLNEYFETDGAVVTSVEEINNFDTLKAVVEDITAKKDELGIEGAFTSAGMDSSSDWRFKTHLANLPIYYEYKADGITSTDAIKGTYLDNYKNIWDLYINNATCEPTMISSKSAEDARAEFALGEAVFYQNGTWETNGILEEGDLTEDDLGMLPIYIGVEGEENQGLCTGTQNYWCVNAWADEADIQATLDFMYWCVTSEEGTTAMANDMGFVIPFKKAVESPNLFVKVDNAMTAAGKTPVAWNFSTMPSENWKNGVGSALTAYAAGTGTWDAVVTAFVDGWATEAALNAAA